MSGILSQKASTKSAIGLRNLFDVNEGNFDRYRPDTIYHNQLLVSYNVRDRPKEFVFKYITDLLVAGTGVTFTTVDGVTTIDASGGGATTLAALTDVSLSSPINGDVLLYNGTAWINTPLTGGGDMLKSVYDTDNDGIVDKAESVQIIVRNSTGVTLTKGQVVYLFGATGNRPNAVLSDATTEATSSKTIGLVSADILNNADGYVTVSGTMHDLVLNMFADGDRLWLNNVPGGMVANTPPAEPNHAVFIGTVARAHPTQGRLVLAIQNGYELTELHGVLITGTPSNGQVLAYNSTTTLWENTTLSGVSGVTASSPLTSSGGATPNISTSMATNKLIGRGTAGVGVMEEITIGTGLSLSSTTLNAGNIDLAVISVTSTNAREDNWAPTGWPGTTDVVKVIDFTPNNTNNIISLGGLANPSAGKIVTIVNSSTNNLVIIENESSTSTAANRFKLAQKSPYFLMPEREITFLYTGTRWSQFNTHPNQGGFDFYDDFENINQVAGSQSTKMFYGLTSGTGSGLVSGAENNTDWGIMRLTAGTTITGFLYASVDYRRFGASTIFGVNGLCPQLWVSRVKIDTVPTAAQDWNFNAGLNASSSTVATNGQTGLMWEMPTFASGGVTPAFWNVRITNTSNALTILTATSVPITAATYIYLGIFITSSNNGDAIFFYSTDGITYSFAYRFTRVSGNYGGLPFYRLAGAAGTLASRSASVDWCGESFNLKR